MTMDRLRDEGPQKRRGTSEETAGKSRRTEVEVEEAVEVDISAATRQQEENPRGEKENRPVR